MRRRPPRAPANPARGREGFTLLELLIVTVILGILAMLASIPVAKAREKAMVTAAKTELRQLSYAIELYWTERWVMPPSLGDLSGFSRSPDIRVCDFTPGEEAGEPFVRLEAQHRASSTRVSTRYPVDGGRMVESPAPTACADVGGGAVEEEEGPGRGNGRGGGRGNGNGRGRG